VRIPHQKRETPAPITEGEREERGKKESTESEPVKEKTKKITSFVSEFKPRINKNSIKSKCSKRSESNLRTKLR